MPFNGLAELSGKTSYDINMDMIINSKGGKLVMRRIDHYVDNKRVNVISEEQTYYKRDIKRVSVTDKISLAFSNEEHIHKR